MGDGDQKLCPNESEALVAANTADLIDLYAETSSMTHDNELITLLAGLIQGDRWLSADACAAYLGQIKRRTFLETIACQPDFPKPVPVGKVKAWKKSEIEEWAETRRQRSNRAA